MIRRRRFPFAAAGIAVVVLLVVAGSIGLSMARVNTVTEHTACVVEEKDSREVAALTDKPVRVYTSCGVFEVQDEPFRFHFSSADVYSDLKVGETVDLGAVGWRVPLLSWFPNVVEVAQ